MMIQMDGHMHAPRMCSALPPASSPVTPVGVYLSFVSPVPSCP